MGTEDWTVNKKMYYHKQLLQAPVKYKAYVISELE